MPLAPRIRAPPMSLKGSLQGGHNRKDFWVSTTSKNDNFGWDVSIHDDVIAVGSIFDGIGDLSTGMIHVFARNLPGINTWGESFVGLGSDSCDGAFFGRSVAVDGSDIVTHDFVNPCNNNRSAVYVFKP